MVFLYILQSVKDKSYYIGITENIKDRLIKHNQGRVLSTKSKKPFILVRQEHYNSRSDAYKRERYLKSLKSRKVLEKLFMPSSSSSVQDARFSS
ncbi:GIY-YIG nuclease family protein [Patescibacteria group bacterium]|nr:GIY-YIG nuclease family protein [Patescibacteria group bacterium]